MKKVIGALVFVFIIGPVYAQSISQRLEKAYDQFEADSQMKHGISSLYVIDASTGEVVFDRHSAVGLAPASTQKIITSVTAFELLGKDFRYQTQMGVEKRDGKNILHFYGNGDPSFGSPRWSSTNGSQVLQRWVQALQAAHIKKVDFIDLVTQFSQSEIIPDGWIWQDIGNYYGAGASGFNWRENQYDIILHSGENIGDKVSIVSTIPKLYDIELVSFLKSASKNSGDNAYVYYPFDNNKGVIRGTIPIREPFFKISAAYPSGFPQFLHALSDTLKTLDIKIPGEPSEDLPMLKKDVADVSILQTELSPPLDSIIYWFNKKSINLYGEALVKTMGVKLTGFATTDTGVAVVKRFWKEKGLEPDELNMYDGSGLSPLNRVTTHAQVEVLKYAKGQEWFPYFYDALPEYNGMKMKSGTISDVKGFCGYQTSKEGRQYIFSFLVNNYGGRTGAMVGKMYKVLDELK